jgi:hypothetical protein
MNLFCAVLNGGPYDGKLVSVVIDKMPKGIEEYPPHIYCGFMGDGYVRIYDKQDSGKYQYVQTISSKGMDENE